jgi:hypothetical protein
LQLYFEEGQRELKRVIDSFRPDIIECQHIWTIPYMVRTLGHPYLLTAHHSDQMGYRYDRRMQQYANQAGLRCPLDFRHLRFCAQGDSRALSGRA